jgi:hypothetical protein
VTEEVAMHASGTFDIESWDEQPYDEQEGVKLTRTRVIKTFHGDLEGKSTAELLMVYAREGSAAYTGFERISGRLGGRAGSFVLYHSASLSSEGQSALWRAVSESGTGELAQLRGEMDIVSEPGGGHSFTLDYELE